MPSSEPNLSSNCRSPLHKDERGNATFAPSASHETLPTTSFTTVNSSLTTKSSWRSYANSSSNNWGSQRSTGSGGNNWGNQGLDASGKLSSLGNFFMKRAWSNPRVSDGEMDVGFPAVGDVVPDDSKDCNDTTECYKVPTANGPTLQRANNGRRAPTTRRTMLQKSSRSFLETRGVVFPVSSFEVLDKGCMERKKSTRLVAGNEEWPEF